ncbi:MAG: radical SAM protein [Clostridia bacterium]|nr:radical SAM protein [Clostridia bacterium]
MNQYLKNLNKIEFVVTNACTGSCKHCFEGAHEGRGDRIDTILAREAVTKISCEYDVKTVMAFGGEPLLHSDAVMAIMSAATEAGVPKRQVITNGFFTTDKQRMRDMATALLACGVNDLLLSVDAFHQETIPLEVVRCFAEELARSGVPTRLQPAWLVSYDDNNPYNEKTRELLASFADLDIPVGDGNIVFPEGNARVFLSEYFTDDIPINPYVEDPTDLRCISFSANGDVLDGNIYKRDIMDIIAKYKP